MYELLRTCPGSLYGHTDREAGSLAAFRDGGDVDSLAGGTIRVGS